MKVFVQLGEHTGYFVALSTDSVVSRLVGSLLLNDPDCFLLYTEQK